MKKRKRCPRCEKTKRAECFGKVKRRGKIVLQSYCTPCMNSYHVERRKKSPAARKAHRAVADRRRKELQKEVAAYKADRPCRDCGYHYKPWQMQFDHPVGVEKLGNVSELVNRVGSPTRIWEEIEKCELVCANCHADRTYMRNQGAIARS